MTHKKQKSKYISFLIVTEDRNEPKSFRIHKGILRVASTILIGIAVLIIIGALTYWKAASLALDNNRLKEENFNLRKGLDQVEKIKEELGSVRKFENQIRSSLNGYVSVDKADEEDSVDVKSIDFDKLSVDKRMTIFNSIPAVQPVAGFIARGYDASPLMVAAHMGVDIAAPTGKAVVAPADGIVLFSGWTVEGGNMLIVNHGFGFLSVYKHNQRNLVNDLERISKGQVIALLGNTGKISSGPHLHYEVWKNGLPVNPLYYLTEKDKKNI